MVLGEPAEQFAEHRAIQLAAAGRVLGAGEQLPWRFLCSGFAGIGAQQHFVAACTARAAQGQQLLHEQGHRRAVELHGRRQRARLFSGQVQRQLLQQAHQGHGRCSGRQRGREREAVGFEQQGAMQGAARIAGA